MKSSKRAVLLGGALLASGLLAAAPTHAQQLQARESTGSEKGFVGGLLGLGTASDDLGGGIAYGIRGGYYLRDNIGAGLFLQSADHDLGITSLAIGLEGLYRLDDFVPGVSAAVDLATVKFSGTGLEGDYNFGFGARLAYDYRLPGTTPISIGAEGGILFTKPGDDMLVMSHILAAARFWF